MEFSAELIAMQLGGAVEGDPGVAVSTFAKIEEGHPGALSFLANPKYTHYIYSTESSVVLVRRDFVAEHPVKATLIRVDDPYEAMTKLMQMAVKAMEGVAPRGIEEPCHVAAGVEVPDDCYVGAFAYVGQGVSIGRGVKIYPQCYVGDGVTLGEGTTLYPGVKIYHGCRIGKNCTIHSGAVIGADGFGFAPLADGSYDKIPQIGIVEIADNVEIGANTTVDRSTMGCTRIGEGSKIDNLVQIAHNVEVGRNTVVAAQAGFAGTSKIGDNCMIGGQVGVAGHISVGDRTVIGAQSGIPNNVKAGSRLMGYPAVDARDFARRTVMVKNLDKLYARVDQLEKSQGDTK